VQYDVEVNGLTRHVTVKRRDGRFVVSMGDLEWTVDVASVAGHTLSLLVERRSHGAENGGKVVESHEVSLARDAATGQTVVGIGAIPVLVGLNSHRPWGRAHDAGSGAAGPQRVVAPMPGKVVRLLAKAGDAVASRQPIVVIEAMKMENELRASRDGSVSEVLVQEGQSVEAGTLLAIITPP